MKKKLGISFIVIACILFGIATIDLIMPGKGSVLSRINKLGLSIDDFELISRTEGNENYSRLKLDFKNNSKYDIVQIKATYKVKENLSKKEKELFKEILEEEDNKDINPSDINIRIDQDSLIKKGKTYKNISFLEFSDDERSYMFGDITEDIFKLMKVKELSIAAIAEDGQVYLATYSERKKSWDIEKANGKANIWPKDHQLTSEISPPPFEYFIVVEGLYGSDLNFKAYDITKEDYVNYVKKMKTAGFSKGASKDYETSGYLTATNSNGREITIVYYPLDEKITVSISL